VNGANSPTSFLANVGEWGLRSSTCRKTRTSYQQTDNYQTGAAKRRFLVSSEQSGKQVENKKISEARALRRVCSTKQGPPLAGLGGFATLIGGQLALCFFGKISEA